MLCICTGVCRHACDSQHALASILPAVLKSRPRLIDLHYLIVQRLPPAARAYASAFCFILGLNMEFSGCADDKYQVTAAFRRWLECDSRIPRTWGALLVALRREISPTWVDDITEDLVRKYAHADVCTCHDNVQNLRGVCMSGPCLVDMHLQLPPCTLYCPCRWRNSSSARPRTFLRELSPGFLQGT